MKVSVSEGSCNVCFVPSPTPSVSFVTRPRVPCTQLFQDGARS